MKVNKKILTLGALSLLPISILPLVVISCGSSEVTYFESEGFRIASNGTIMGFIDPKSKHSGELEIKEQYEKVTIKHIARAAFSEQTLITSISLPKTLVSIGQAAFKQIKSPVFYPSDQDPNIPVKWDLSHLTNLEIIEDFAFFGDLPTSNQPQKQKLELNLSSLNKLKTIGENAFRRRAITSLSLPNAIEIIEESAFKDNQLTSLSLPNSITTIGNEAFQGNQLTSITIPDSVMRIGIAAFESNKINNLSLPKSIIEIQGFASNQLTTLDLSNLFSLTTIISSAFASNPLTSLSIPEWVTTIGDNAFRNNALTSASEIILPSQFDTPTERKRIGLPPKTPASAPLETEFIPLTIENRVKGKLK